MNENSQSSTSIAIINSHASFDHSFGKEALDIALIYGTYEQTVSLFFQGEGVRQLIAQQNPELINAKDYLATFSALTFYDVENLYVCQKSLAERGLESNFHVDGVELLTAKQFTQQLKQHQILLRF